MNRSWISNFILSVASFLTIVIAFVDVALVTRLLTLGFLLSTVGYWFLKEESQRKQSEEIQRMRSAYEQLDQQAKLIVQTDLALHRTQEELDRKLASLFALQKLGQELRISLSPEEIYGKLNAQLVTSFGFTRGLLGSSDNPDALIWQALVGITDEKGEDIRRHLLQHRFLHALLTSPTPTIWTTSTTDPHIRRLLELLQSTSVVITSIKPTSGLGGCLLLTRQYADSASGRGDEELAAILATQLATAIENSSLYEEAWKSRQDLERKIQDRTKELAALNQQLMRLNKAKSDFVSAVSHELRTPMAAIKGYASLLRSGQFGPLDASQAERIAKIEKQTDLLTQLINNLLDIARIESGRVTMEHRPIDAQEFLASAVDVIKPQADAKHLTVAVDLDGITHIMGDPTHLPRVLINLLSNAVKYSPEGGTITISVMRQGERIAIAVRDQGCGIDPTDVPKLFQEFYRAANPVNEQVRGTGLGLALVKRIIEAHQGKIWIDSEAHKGTTVVFTLPDAPAPTS